MFDGYVLKEDFDLCLVQLQLTKWRIYYWQLLIYNNWYFQYLL